MDKAERSINHQFPHALIFPLPIQGPVNCCLKLAELLSLSGIYVTFLNTQHVQTRLLRCTDVGSRFKSYPNFCFEIISDGLPDNHPRASDQLMDVINGINVAGIPQLKDMLISSTLSRNSESCPVTVIIADGFFSFAVDIAKEVGIPLIYFETISPCSLWTNMCLPKLIEAGEIPFKDSDLDVMIENVRAMEGFLRRRDLPSFCRSEDPSSDHFVQDIIKEVQHLPRANGLIVNTFEELETTILPQIRTQCPNLYSLGPIHLLFKAQFALQTKSPPPATSNSLWQEERSCLSWLNSQPSMSVIYVSIGSLATMSMDQLIEMWHGLVNSGKRFLWVRRRDSVTGDYDESKVLEKLLEATKERGCIVEWAPQEEVLAHPAIGGFLTHSGWNSTLESIVEGVPMICWPYFMDQQVNSRYVSEVWRIGIDMKDSCDRITVEKMVRELMDDRRDEFMKSTNSLMKLAAQSATQKGSSFGHLERLIGDIKCKRLQAKGV